MNELIEIRRQPAAVDGEAAIRTVDARELHHVLGIAKDFSDWFKAQVSRAKLLSNRDYGVILPQKDERQGGQNRIDYWLNVDAAKHVAMMAGTEKGFQVREYFIDCERRAANPGAQLSRMDLIRLAMEAELEVQKLGAHNKALQQVVDRTAPMASALERIAAAPADHCITDAAKILRVKPKELFDWMKANGWIYRRESNSRWAAYQTRIESGHLRVAIAVVGAYQDGTEKTSAQVRVTQKGIARLSMVFGKAVLQKIA